MQGFIGHYPRWGKLRGDGREKDNCLPPFGSGYRKVEKDELYADLKAK